MLRYGLSTCRKGLSASKQQLGYDLAFCVRSVSCSEQHGVVHLQSCASIPRPLPTVAHSGATSVGGIRQRELAMKVCHGKEGVCVAIVVFQLTSSAGRYTAAQFRYEIVYQIRGCLCLQKTVAKQLHTQTGFSCAL